MAPDTFIVWEGALRDMVEGLDLEDPEDRAAFRMRVIERTKNVRVDFIRQLARDCGYRATRTNSRHAAQRALADGYISRRRGIMPAQIG